MKSKANRLVHHYHPPHAARIGSAARLLPRVATLVRQLHQTDHSPSLSWYWRALTNAAARHGWAYTMRALSLARYYHAGQTRRTGEPYITHPLRAAYSLYLAGLDDDEVLAAAILHDAYEDCGERLAVGDLEAKHGFTPAVEATVRLLAKLPGIDEDDYYSAVAESRGAALAKCADRLDNLATMKGAYTPEKATEYLEETNFFVVPLCRRGTTRVGGLREPMRRLEPVLLRHFDAAQRLVTCMEQVRASA